MKEVGPLRGHVQPTLEPAGGFLVPPTTRPVGRGGRFPPRPPQHEIGPSERRQHRDVSGRIREQLLLGTRLADELLPITSSDDVHTFRSVRDIPVPGTWYMLLLIVVNAQLYNNTRT